MPVPDIPDIDAGCAVFLDLDGTLVEIAGDRDAVVVSASVCASIEQLHDALAGALALVSGRRLDDIDRMTGGLVRRRALAIAAEHGAACRGPGVAFRRPVAPPGWDETRSDLRAAVARTPGLDLEEKDVSLALHFRSAPGLARAARLLAERAAGRLGGEYVLRDGKMVIEIAPRGRDKGKAIEAILRTQPFVGRRPVFIGDDVTDEDGFGAVNARDGISVKVGPGPTVAHYRLDDVAQVTGWLDRQARRLASPSPSASSPWQGAGGDPLNRI